MFKEFFYFNKSDRKVLLFLLSLGVSSALLFFVLSDTETFTTDAIEKDSIHSRTYFYKPDMPLDGQPVSRRIERFVFDPNTADSTQLLRLGLQRWQIRNIYKYRAAGGVYRRPADFARLYGLTRKQYLALEPFIRISDDYRPASEWVADKAPVENVLHRDTLHYPVKLKPTERVALNLADTSLLKRVPGIGSYFARRIVSYRQRLGGFYDVKQLLEIDNFPEEALPYFSLSAERVQPIRINRLTLNQLKQHPYITYYMARDIADYRRLKGPIQSLDDLKMLRDFTPEIIERLRPYVVFE